MKTKSLLIYVLAFLLMLSGISCGEQEPYYVENPFLGKWVCSERKAGSGLEKAELSKYDYKFEIFEQQRMKIIQDGTPMDAAWRQEKEDIIAMAGGVDMHLKIRGAEITAYVNNELTYVFVREDSTRGKELLSALSGVLPSDKPTVSTEARLTETSTEKATETPTTSTEVTVTTTTTPTTTATPPPPTNVEDKWIDDWYGYFTISNAKGAFAGEEGMYDMWGSIFIDTGTGIPAFETYLNKDMIDSFISMYVSLNEAYVQPLIGDEDAWFHDRYLTPEEEISLTFTENDGFIMLTYNYVDPEVAGDSYSITIVMRRYGDRWEGQSLTPPGFEEYISDLDASGV